MKTFKDTEGREWRLSVNAFTLKALRDAKGIDLLSVTEKESGLMGRLFDDHILVAEVAYHLCQSQIKERGVSEESFYSAMAGDAIDGALTAIVDDLGAFFRDAKVRGVFVDLVTTTRDVINKSVDRMAKRLGGVNVEALVDQVMAGHGHRPQ